MSDIDLLRQARAQYALEQRVGQTEVREVPLYQTGVWAPAFGGTTGDGTIIYDLQLGGYTRIGNICIARFHINTNTVTAVPTGNLQVIGLPFTAVSSAGAGPGPSVLTDYSFLNLNAGYTQVGLRVISASARATLTQSGDNVGALFVPGTAMVGSNVEVVGTLIYEVA